MKADQDAIPGTRTEFILYQKHCKCIVLDPRDEEQPPATELSERAIGGWITIGAP